MVSTGPEPSGPSSSTPNAPLVQYMLRPMVASPQPGTSADAASSSAQVSKPAPKRQPTPVPLEEDNINQIRDRLHAWMREHMGTAQNVRLVTGPRAGTVRQRVCNKNRFLRQALHGKACDKGRFLECHATKVMKHSWRDKGRDKGL